MTDWTHDPLERARWLDGEGTPQERAEREAHLGRDPLARARIDVDAAFLRTVRRAREALPAPSELFEARLRRDLAIDRGDVGRGSTGAGVRRPRSLRAVLTIAATVLAAGGLWLAAGFLPTVIASDQDAVLAARTFRAAELGQGLSGIEGAGCEEGTTSPHRFPPVSAGELSLEGCSTPMEGRSVSVLRPSSEGGAPRGLVAVPWDGKSVASDIGWTRVGEIVVFDVICGRAKYYVASRWDVVAGTPSCAVCHGPARADTPTRNPHRIFERLPGP